MYKGAVCAIQPEFKVRYKNIGDIKFGLLLSGANCTFAYKLITLDYVK